MTRYDSGFFGRDATYSGINQLNDNPAPPAVSETTVPTRTPGFPIARLGKAAILTVVASSVANPLAILL